MVSRYVPLGPFSYTATGDLGEQRDPMLINELHLRDRVGQAKVRGHFLPGKGFAYGRPNDKREYTALDALRGWTGCIKTLEDKPKKPLGRDFMALNRAAVSAGLVSAKEYSDYRTTHDYRVKPPPELRARATMKFPSSMVFGQPPRPQTPMFDLLEHKYQDKWIRQIYDKTMAEREKTHEKKHHMMNYDTRAAMLRTYQNPVDPAPLWKMPRFANWAKPHLQTFRTCRDKKESWKYFDLDSVSRKGTLGQGIYESAKN